MQSIPRLVEYDHIFTTLRLTPLPELTQLRSTVLATLSSRQVAPTAQGAAVTLVGSGSCGGSGFEEHCYRQEVVVNIAVPNSLFDGSITGLKEVRVGIAVHGVGASLADAHTFIGMVRNYSLEEIVFQNQTFRGAMDFKHIHNMSCTNVSSCTRECASLCSLDTRCGAWSYLGGASSPYCALKVVGSQHLVPSAETNSGVPPSAWFGADRSLSLTRGSMEEQHGRTSLYQPHNASHSMLTLQVFVDRSVVEGFKDNGLDRVATRVYVDQNKKSSSGIGIVFKATTDESTTVSVPSIEIRNATAWTVDSIWKAF